MKCTSTHSGLDTVTIGKLGPGDKFFWCGEEVTVLEGPLRESIKRKPRQNLEPWQDAFQGLTLLPSEKHKAGRYVFERVTGEVRPTDVYFVRRSAKSNFHEQHLGIGDWCTLDPALAAEHLRRLELMVAIYQENDGDHKTCRAKYTEATCTMD